MSGTKMLVKEGKVNKYFSVPDPYKSAPSCNLNLLELTRYATKCGKKLMDLSVGEVSKFVTK